MSKPRYCDEYGVSFEGPYGVGTLLGDDVMSYPTEDAARKAAQESLSENDWKSEVYGPPLETPQGVHGTIRARKIAVYTYNQLGGAPQER